MGLSASSVADLSLEELKSAKCQLLFGSAEKVLEERLLNVLKDNFSSIHQHLAAIVIDESHTVEMWTRKRYFLITRFNLADLWLKLLFFLQPSGQGTKQASVLFVRRLADCQLYDHSVNKVRRETFLLAIISTQCQDFRHS